MSDAENKPVDPKPADKPVPAVEPPAPGEYGKLLESQGMSIEHLGLDANGVEMVRVSANQLLSAAKMLRDNPSARFDFLVSVSGLDWKERLEAVYHLYSTETSKKLVLKVNADAERIPSVVSVWPTADWHEREAYDLIGITFEGHPNLERILMPSDWLGHPLRKDYKVTDPRLVWNER